MTAEELWKIDKRVAAELGFRFYKSVNLKGSVFYLARSADDDDEIWEKDEECDPPFGTWVRGLRRFSANPADADTVLSACLDRRWEVRRTLSPCSNNQRYAITEILTDPYSSPDDDDPNPPKSPKFNGRHNHSDQCGNPHLSLCIAFLKACEAQEKERIDAMPDPALT
jgi:hypothetical protein